jgi:hypothetical protein
MRLDPRFRYAIYAAFSALFLSGIVWLVADRLKDSPDGEMWQAISAKLLMLHGGVAMAALMLLGALIPVHLLRAWRAKKNRQTGIIMTALNAVLILSAFGLYYMGGEELRPFMSNMHIVAGCALPAMLGVHIYLGRLRSKAASQQRQAARMTA